MMKTNNKDYFKGKRQWILLILIMWMLPGLRAQDVTIEGDLSNRSVNMPLYAGANESYGQYIYTRSEVGGAKTITNIAFHCDGSRTAARRHLRIFMGDMTMSTFSSQTSYTPLDVWSSNLCMVFAGEVEIHGEVDGWTTIYLNAPFEWSGATGHSLMVAVYDLTGDHTRAVDAPVFYTNSSDANRSLYCYSYEKHIDIDRLSRLIPDSVDRAYHGFDRPDIRLGTESTENLSLVPVVEDDFIDNFSDTMFFDTSWSFNGGKGYYWKIGVPEHINPIDGTSMAYLFVNSSDGRTASMSTPWMRSYTSESRRISFDYNVSPWGNDKDSLVVYYRTGEWGYYPRERWVSEWRVLFTACGDTGWHHFSADIGHAEGVQFRFEGHAGYGFGIAIDNLSVTYHHAESLTTHSDMLLYVALDLSDGSNTDNFYRSNLTGSVFDAKRFSVAPSPGAYAAAYADSTLYWISTDGYLRALPYTDETTDASQARIVGTVNNLERVAGMNYNPLNHTMYVLSWMEYVGTGDVTTLYAINLDAATTTRIGIVGAPVRALAINRNGEAYGISYDGKVYRLNLNNGKATELFSTPLYFNSVNTYVDSRQALAFDPVTDELVFVLGDKSYGRCGIYKIDIVNDTFYYVGLLHNKSIIAYSLTLLPNKAGIAQSEGSVRVEVYPNPSAGRMTIESSEPVVSWELLSTTGATLQQGQGASVDASRYPAGLYLIRIKTVRGVAVRRVVIQ